MPLSLDFEKISSEIIRSIRGHRSAEVLSKEMGFSKSQVRRWETLYVKIKWSQFVELCRHCRTPIDEAIQGLRSIDSNVDVSDAPQVFFQLTRGFNQTQIARRLEVSRQTVQRWMSGQSELTLIDILKAMRLYSGVHLQFLKSLGVELKVTSLADEFSIQSELEDLMASYPYVGAFLWFLTLNEYKNSPGGHPTGWVANRLEIPLEEEKQLIDELLKRKVIREEEGRYVPLIRRVPTDKMSTSALNKVKQYWAQVAADKIDSSKAKGGYIEISVPESIEDEILTIVNETLFKLLRLPHQDGKYNSADKVKVITVNMFDL